jgi:predicted lipid-binding transport protein (Tim44 family)
MSDSFDITTIVFAALALFVLFKLRSVLGTRTGTERPSQDRFTRQDKKEPTALQQGEGANVVRFPPNSTAEEPIGAKESNRPRWEKFAGEKAWGGLDAIAAADSSFEVKSFIEGARAAYEMILTAFAAGDKKTLRDLLASEVFDGFASAITARESRGEKIEMSFVSIEKSQIDDAHMRGETAQVTVRFNSKLITSTRDRDNKVVDGNPEKVVDNTDIWTFARDARSRDPNWKLIATETGN